MVSYFRRSLRGVESCDPDLLKSSTEFENNGPILLSRGYRSWEMWSQTPQAVYETLEIWHILFRKYTGPESVATYSSENLQDLKVVAPYSTGSSGGVDRSDPVFLRWSTGLESWDPIRLRFTVNRFECRFTFKESDADSWWDWKRIPPKFDAGFREVLLLNERRQSMKNVRDWLIGSVSSDLVYFYTPCWNW